MSTRMAMAESSRVERNSSHRRERRCVMPRTRRDTHHRIAAGVGCAAVVAAGLVLFLPMAVQAQNRPPLLEPIALEGTMKQFYRGANVVIVTTMDGVEHV